MGDLGDVAWSILRQPNVWVAFALLSAALLWRHASPGERNLLKAVMAGMAIMPLALLGEQGMCRHLDATQGISLYNQAFARGAEPQLASKIAAPGPSAAAGTFDPEDSLYHMLAGSLWYMKQGNLMRAREASNRALRLFPADPLSLVHAGNLAMIAYDYKEAAARYAAARESDGGLTEAWFNASQAELYSNNSTSHKRFLDKAAEIDPQRVTRFLKDNDELFASVPPLRKAMDPMLRPMQAWEHTWESLLKLELGTVAIRSGIFRIPAPALMGAILLLALGLHFRFRNCTQALYGRDLFACRICGRIMCRTCRKGVHCQNCFKAVAGIHDARMRDDMVVGMRARVETHSLRLQRAIDFAVPGAGGLVAGTRRDAFAWLLAASMGFGLVHGSTHLLMEYPDFVTGRLVWLAWLPVAGVYALHHSMLLRGMRVRKARAADPSLRQREAFA